MRWIAGHQWVIDEADLARLDRRGSGRPLSPRSAWILIRVAEFDAAERDDKNLAPRGAQSIAPSDRSKARRRIRDLLADAASSDSSDPESAAAEVAAMLRNLLANRAERRVFRASPQDLADLRADDRIQLSGVSESGSGIASGDLVEGYVEERHVEDLARDLLLVPARHSDANVVLHVVDLSVVPDRELRPHGWALLAADLAEHHRPREVARAAEIVGRIAGRQPVLRSRD